MSTFACVFPGQGSQSLGMLADLATDFTIVQESFSEASEALGEDLWELSQNGPEEELNQTQNTQPALLAASVAVWRVLQAETGLKASYFAGHSLGEYSALVCAGSLSFADGIRLVAKRGELMQSAVPQGTGAMFAIIGLDDESIAKACEQAAQGQVVTPVNYNSPGQVVIAGNKEAAERAAELCKQAGAKRALPLSVSVPSHCALMQPAAVELEKVLATLSISAPNIPVINNVDVTVEDGAEGIQQALVRQLYSPVRWTETIQWLAEQGVEQVLEVGPGKVLTGLIKRIDKSLNAVAVNTTDNIASLKG